MTQQAFDICTGCGHFAARPDELECSGCQEATSPSEYVDFDNQLGRRNLTPAAAANLRGLQYRAEKQDQGGTGANQHKQTRQNDGTAHRLAKKHGVSPRTIERDARFSERLEEIGKTHPEVRDDILTGKTGLTRADVENRCQVQPAGMLDGRTEATPGTAEIGATSAPRCPGCDRRPLFTHRGRNVCRGCSPAYLGALARRPRA